MTGEPTHRPLTAPRRRSLSVGGGSTALLSCPLEKVFDGSDHMLSCSQHLLGNFRRGLIPGVVDPDPPLFESTKETAGLRVIEGAASLGEDAEMPVRPGVGLGCLPDDGQCFLHGVEGGVVGP